MAENLANVKGKAALGSGPLRIRLENESSVSISQYLVAEVATSLASSFEIRAGACFAKCQQLEFVRI